MTSAGTTRVTLELDRGGDPIRGRIDHPDGTCRRFWGWLELIEELRSAATGAVVVPPDGPDQNDSTQAGQSAARADPGPPPQAL